MRIAFVAPKWNEMVNSYPPLGLGYLAAVTEAEGHTAAIFDLGLTPDTPLERDVERIAAFSPDLVGFTAMTNNYHSVQETISLLRLRLGSECPFVIGGPHATLFPKRIAADSHIDYVIYGEGEETLRELVRALVLAGPFPPEATLRNIRGLVFASRADRAQAEAGKTTGAGAQTGGARAQAAGSADTVIVTPARPLIRDLDTLPFPARHLYDLSRYPLCAPNGEPMVTLLSSRGCPYNCSYCFKGIVGHTYRRRSPENVISEIHTLINDYGYRNYYFIDDLFTLDYRRLAAITDRMIAEHLDIRWQCLARVDRVKPHLLKRMAQAGCREVHYGIESGNPDILKNLGKQITLDQVRQAVKWTVDADILVKGYFMLGLPGDTEETMQQTIRFASELELDQAMFSLTTPFPGTRLWDEVVARYPGTEYNQDFSKAYYYIANNDHLIKPFLNVSRVSDERLAQLAFEAQAKFQESKRRHKYYRALGPGLGKSLYSLSNIRLFRKIGHTILRIPRFLRRIPGIGNGKAETQNRGLRRGLGALGHYDLREEYSQKWK